MNNKKHRKMRIIISIVLCLSIVIGSFTHNVQRADAFAPIVAEQMIYMIAQMIVLTGITFYTTDALMNLATEFYYHTLPNIRSSITSIYESATNGIATITGDVWNSIQNFVQSKVASGEFTAGEFTYTGKVFSYNDSNGNTIPYKIIPSTGNGFDVVNGGNQIFIDNFRIENTSWSHLSTYSWYSFIVWTNGTKTKDLRDTTYVPNETFLGVWAHVNQDQSYLSLYVGAVEGTYNMSLPKQLIATIPNPAPVQMDLFGEDILATGNSAIPKNGDGSISLPLATQTEQIIGQDYDSMNKVIENQTFDTYIPPYSQPWEQNNTIPYTFPWENENDFTWPWEQTGDITNPYEEPVTDARDPSIATEVGLLTGLWEWLKNIYNLIKNGILGFLKSIIDFLKWIIMAIVSGITALLTTITDLPGKWIPKIPEGITAFFPNLLLLILALIALFTKAILFVGSLASIGASTSMLHPSIVQGINFARNLSYNGVSLYGLIMGITNIFLGLIVFKLLKKMLLGIGEYHEPKGGKP